MSTKIEKLLQENMSRKQFLLTVGGIIGSVLGYSSIMGIISKSTKNESGDGVGYGLQNYGL